MARVRFDDNAVRATGWVEARLVKPLRPLPGYTANTTITEWLTVNCRGAWASKAQGRSLRVRFADPEDRDRAVARFGAAARPTEG